MYRDTLEALHEACRDALAPIHMDSIKTISVTLVAAVNVLEVDNPNASGLVDCAAEPLINVGFTDNGTAHYRYLHVSPLVGEFVHSPLRMAPSIVIEISAIVVVGILHLHLKKRQSGNPEAVRSRFDPEGLFQRGYVGGFTLGVDGDR